MTKKTFEFSKEQRDNFSQDLITWEDRSMGFDWLVKAIEDNINTAFSSREGVEGGESGQSAEEILKAELKKWIAVNFPFSDIDDQTERYWVMFEEREISLKAMTTYAAQVSADKDEHIKSLMDNFSYETGKLESALTTAKERIATLDRIVKDRPRYAMYIQECIEGGKMNLAQFEKATEMWDAKQDYTIVSDSEKELIKAKERIAELEKEVDTLKNPTRPTLGLNTDSLFCDGCGNRPSVVIRTSRGTFCEFCNKY